MSRITIVPAAKVVSTPSTLTSGRKLFARRRGLVRQLAVLLLVDLVITVVFTTIGGLPGFGETLLEVNAVGFGIWGSSALLGWITRDRMPIWTKLTIAIPVGFVIGGKFSALLGTPDFVDLILANPAHEWRSIIADLALACTGCGFFVSYARSEALRNELQVERGRTAEALQSETSARLALLQAQIEPHFLFNTLANARSAMDSDPPAAKAILEHLNRYLRVSLGRTRGPTATLAEEVGLVEALLEIAALRLGTRMRFGISIPQALGETSLPPLLLQPLVENAVRHGIEPSVEGGEIRIEAARDGDQLCVRVIDTGAGFDAGSPEGIGLANVRTRLERLYGDRGRLAIFRNAPRGTVAQLTLPLQGP